MARGEGWANPCDDRTYQRPSSVRGGRIICYGRSGRKRRPHSLHTLAIAVAVGARVLGLGLGVGGGHACLRLDGLRACGNDVVHRVNGR